MEGWGYLAVLLDLFSRRVVEWAMELHMRVELPLKALKMACQGRLPPTDLIHHTDRGSQYASKVYRSRLAEQGMVCSMSRRGECWDNAAGEIFFGSLKDDLIYRGQWETRTQLMAAVNDYIEHFYNSRRRHSPAGNLPPTIYEAKTEHSDYGINQRSTFSDQDHFLLLP